MLGLMQDWPLLCHRIIEHAAKYHGTQEVVTRSVEGPIHRTNYAEIHARSLKVSQRLDREGIKLGDRESVQIKLGEVAQQIQISRLLTMHAAWMLDQGGRARKEVSMAKVQVANTLHQAADVAIQLQGARGFSKDTVVEWIYRAARAARLTRIARIAFGVSAVLFGLAHFVYMNYTAPLVPTWLPPSQEFWGYATGVFHIAGGLAIVAGIRARLAAVLLAAMYASFIPLVFVPVLMAETSSAFRWTECATTIVLVGVAWTVADSLRPIRT